MNVPGASHRKTAGLGQSLNRERDGRPGLADVRRSCAVARWGGLRRGICVGQRRVPIDKDVVRRVEPLQRSFVLHHGPAQRVADPNHSRADHHVLAQQGHVDAAEHPIAGVEPRGDQGGQRQRQRPGTPAESQGSASKTSATATIRPDSGIASPLRWCGYPAPSHRSWWLTEISVASRITGEVLPFRMRWPRSAWSSISRRSSGVSAPGLSRMESGTAILPTSCIVAARLSCRHSVGDWPSASAISPT